MSLENTKDLNLFFSEENLEFLKNINQELIKIDNLKRLYSKLTSAGKIFFIFNNINSKRFFKHK